MVSVLAWKAADRGSSSDRVKAKNVKLVCVLLFFICLILFLTNYETKYMAVFHFLKSTSNDVTDVYFN
jgi:hypothetical protein